MNAILTIIIPALLLFAIGVDLALLVTWLRGRWHD
jgi:hypothetical protein